MMPEKKEKKREMTAEEAGGPGRHKGGVMARTHGHEFYEDTSHKGSEKGGHKG